MKFDQDDVQQFLFYIPKYLERIVLEAKLVSIV